MGEVTNYVLYGIVSPLFFGLGVYFINKYKNYKDPKEKASYSRKRTTYFNTIYFNEIEPLIIDFFKKYLQYLAKSSFSFKNFRDFVNQIYNLTKRKIKLNPTEFKSIIDKSDVFNNIPHLELDPNIIKNLIKGCNNFSKFNKTLSNYKKTGILCFLIFGTNTIILIVFDFFPNTYLYYLGITLFFWLLIIILLIISYFRYYKDTSVIIKEFESQPWVKRGN